MRYEPAELVRMLERQRLDLSSEKHLQEGIEQDFLSQGIVFEREKRLSARDIPDFLVDGGVVIECKLRNKARKIEVFKQLTRYAEYPEVTAIILAANFTMGLPPDIKSKPVYVASLSKGWL